MVNVGKYTIHGSNGFKYFSCSSQHRRNDPNWRVESWNHQWSCACEPRMWKPTCRDAPILGREESVKPEARFVNEELFWMYFPHPKFGGILCSLPQKSHGGGGLQCSEKISAAPHESVCETKGDRLVKNVGPSWAKHFCMWHPMVQFLWLIVD